MATEHQRISDLLWPPSTPVGDIRQSALAIVGELEARLATWRFRSVCGSSGELLYTDTDGRARHANRNVCDYPESLPVGRCVDCGVDVDPASTDPAVQGCYANRGFGHMRVVGR